MFKVTTERKVKGRNCAYVQLTSYLVREDRLHDWVKYWQQLGCTFQIVEA
jgi:hypothetical protein